MIKSIRTQSDDKGDKFSQEAALSFEGSKDVTRQEYKAETDIRTILAKFGVPNNGAQPAPDLTHTNYDIDLQEAYRLRDENMRLLHRLPPEIRNKYKTAAELIAAIDNGQLEQDILAVLLPKTDEDPDDATTPSEDTQTRERKFRSNMQLRMDRDEDDTGGSQARGQQPRLQRDEEGRPPRKRPHDQ